jgi:tRNA threonylcarbamoyladenosine biosynthesis protein TsaB
MKLLALDTSTLIAGVCVLIDGQVAAEARERVTTHSERLMVLVDGALRQAGLAPGDLDAVACGAGPGSFTGLRIGLATAKGLCYALSRPLVLISSLEALAARVTDGRVAAVLDAHKSEVYAALYDAKEGVLSPLGEESVLSPIALASVLADHAPLFAVGDGLLRYPELLVAGVTALEDGAPRPADLARLAAARLGRGEVTELAHSGPRYIRASEAEIAKSKQAKPEG